MSKANERSKSTLFPNRNLMLEDMEMENEASMELRRFIIDEGPNILIDAINYHLKKRTDFARSFSNRMNLRSLRSRLKKFRGLTDADAYLLGYMLMIYAQEVGSRKAMEAYDYFNDRVLKKLDNMFREE